MSDQDWRSGMDADIIRNFRELALLELKRAERYRNFLSLVVLNLSEFLSSAGRRKISTNKEAIEFLAEAMERIRHQSRITDYIARIDNTRLAILLPETDDSGAWVAGGRVQKVMAEFMAEFLESDYNFEVPIEVSSFPGQAEEVSFVNRLNDLFGDSGHAGHSLN